MHRDIVDPPQKPLDEASPTTERIISLLDRTDEWYSYSIIDSNCYRHEPTGIDLIFSFTDGKLDSVSIHWPKKYSLDKENGDSLFITLSKNESEHVARKILAIRKHFGEPSESRKEECLCEYIDSFMRRGVESL